MELPQEGPSVPPPPYSETDIYSHSHRSYSDRAIAQDERDEHDSIAPSSSTSNVVYTPPESPTPLSPAQAYFESRPVNRVPFSNISVTLTIAPDAAPSDLPYPDWAPGRETSEQDWQTFLNYLIPGHVARINSHVVDRKVRVAEKEESSATEHDIAEAQLGQLKESLRASVNQHDLEAVVREWNDGFFGPRGVTIHPILSGQGQNQGHNDRASPGGSANANQGQNQPEQSASSWWNSFGMTEDGTLRFGDLRISSEGVYSPMFAVDRNGVRWRGQNVTNAGFDPSQHPRSFGGDGERGRSRGLGHRYGQGPGHGHGTRDHSTSSSSSSSSSKSVSSIGSLPDWDDLRDSQLDVAKKSVQAWLAEPDRIVTRDMMKQVKANIKAAKKVKPPPPSPEGDAYREKLRSDVKGLLQNFAALKKRQKTIKREMHQHRRQQKRAVKKERREKRREEKRARRERRRGHEEQDRGSRRAEQGVGMEPPPASVPAVPSAGFRPPPPPPPPPPMQNWPCPVPPFGRGGSSLHRPFGRGGGPFGRGPGGFGHGFGHGFGGGSQAPRHHESPFTNQPPFIDLRSLHSTLENSLRQVQTANQVVSTDTERSMHEMGRRSQAEALRISAESKLATVAALEKQIESNAARLDALLQSRASANNNDNKSNDVGEKAKNIATDSVIQALDTEREQLTKVIDRLRLEADEEYARFCEHEELAEHEHEHEHEHGRR